MTRIVALLSTIVLLTPPLLAQDPSADAEQLWSLEQHYWQYVQANDLDHYRSLWDPNFLGWPSSSPEPLGKDHITDWITTRTSKGQTFQSPSLERLTIRVTGNVATTTYRSRLAWADKTGATTSSTVRVIHTWLRQPDGSWRIISGMSAPTNAEGH